MMEFEFFVPGNPELMERQFRDQSLRYFRTEFTGDINYMTDREDRINFYREKADAFAKARQISDFRRRQKKRSGAQ